MPNLEDRFKGFVGEGEKREDQPLWKPNEERVVKKTKEPKSKNYHPVIFLAIMLGILSAFLGGGYLYLNQGSQKFTKNLEQPVPSVISTPSPTAEAISKDQITVLVLNGTGIKGQAGKVQISLEKLGYKLIDVEIADEESESTVIEYKPGLINSEDLEEIKILLENTYLKVEVRENPSRSSLQITTGSLK